MPTLKEGAAKGSGLLNRLSATIILIVILGYVFEVRIGSFSRAETSANTTLVAQAASREVRSTVSGSGACTVYIESESVAAHDSIHAAFVAAGCTPVNPDQQPRYRATITKREDRNACGNMMRITTIVKEGEREKLNLLSRRSCVQYAGDRTQAAVDLISDMLEHDSRALVRHFSTL